MKNFIRAILAVAVLVPCSVFAEVNMCKGVKDGIFLDNWNDCSSYWTCMGEKAYPGKCSDGFQFSSETQRCDEPSKTKCFPKCNSTLSFHDLYKTCDKFIMCYGTSPIIQECLDGLQYNPMTDRCDYASNVDCVSNLCTGINDPNDIVFVPSKSSCEKYFICNYGFPQPLSCSPGLYFSLEKRGCDFKENVNCTISSRSRNVLPYAKMPPTKASIPCPKKGSHFYPSPSDPASYFFCSNGKGITLTCSPGLVYDKTTESCREPKNVKK